MINASFPTLLFVFAILAALVIYTFMIRSFNKRYKIALNRFLAKEIACRIYQILHPEFKYKVYHIDDQNERCLLDETIKEFEALMQPQKSVTSAHDVTDEKAKQ